MPVLHRFIRIVLEARQAVRGKGPGRARLVVVSTADALDELPDRRILVCPPIGELHEGLVFPDRPLAEVSQDRVFHASAQHPAAQQQRVHLVPIGRRLIHHDPDQPIVPKSVHDANGQTGGAFPPQEVSNLLFRASNGREVELIRSERQLRHAVELIVGRCGDLHAQLQPVDKILQGKGSRLEPLSLRVFLIHLGAGAIFLGRTRVIERPHMMQERRKRLAAARQL